MDLWIFATLAAAAFQTVRFMLHKVLSMGTVSTAGSTFARFAYAAPAAIVLVGGYLLATGQSAGPLPPAFWAYAIAGGTGQILATLCVVAIFASRNFAVGITFKKTEVVQSALLATLILSEPVSLWGWVAIGLGTVGVLLLSDPPDGTGAFWQRIFNRSAGLGLTSGLFFAVAAVGYRGASLQIDSQDALLRAGVTLVCVVLMQAAAMGLYLRLREPGQLAIVWSVRRTAIWLGLTSMAGSLCWFIAFTLQNVAYVNALGQVELVFSLLAAILFFHETVTRRELTGIAVLTVSILVLILAV